MDSLIPQYQAMAETMGGNFGGLSVLNHVSSIKRLMKGRDCKTMLDFGCGRGDAYRSPHKLHHQLGLPRPAVTLYDPAFRPSSALPTGTFDLVICSDVLEHIPEAEITEFVMRLFAYSRKAVWASVCCRPAKKVFPGTDTNLHVTVKPYSWWYEEFMAAGLNSGDRPFALVETP